MAVKQELRPFMHVRKFPSPMAVYPLHAGNKWKGIKVRRKVKDGAQNSLVNHGSSGFWPRWIRVRGGVFLRGRAWAELIEDVDGSGVGAACRPCIQRGGRRAAVHEGRPRNVPCQGIAERRLQRQACARVIVTTAERPCCQMDCRAPC